MVHLLLAASYMLLSLTNIHYIGNGIRFRMFWVCFLFSVSMSYHHRAGAFISTCCGMFSMRAIREINRHVLRAIRAWMRHPIASNVKKWKKKKKKKQELSTQKKIHIASFFWSLGLEGLLLLLHGEASSVRYLPYILQYHHVRWCLYFSSSLVYLNLFILAGKHDAAHSKCKCTNLYLKQ